MHGGCFQPPPVADWAYTIEVRVWLLKASFGISVRKTISLPDVGSDQGFGYREAARKRRGE
jgi:hypothetical protein